MGYGLRRRLPLPGPVACCLQKSVTAGGCSSGVTVVTPAGSDGLCGPCCRAGDAAARHRAKLSCCQSPGALRVCQTLSSPTWGSSALPAALFKLSLEPPSPFLTSVWACLWPYLQHGPELLQVTHLWGGMWMSTVACLQPQLSPGGLQSCVAAVPPALPPFAPAWMDLGPGWTLDLARCLPWLGLLMG